MQINKYGLKIDKTIKPSKKMHIEKKIILFFLSMD